MSLNRDVYCIMGLPFDSTSMLSATTYVSDSIFDARPCFLSTPNLNFVVAAESDELFYESVVQSDFVIADGMPLIWVAKLLGLPFTERVAGSTLFDSLRAREEARPIKVFFFGGEAGIAQLAHERLNNSSSQMESCGFHDPGFVPVADMSTEEIVDKINKAEPDFVLVALGAKKGQSWIQVNRKRLKAPVISHLGAVINFVAGHIERAPQRWQSLGFEWLWRIKQEPGLWKRYWVDGLRFSYHFSLKILPLAIYDRLLLRHYHHAANEIECRSGECATNLLISGSVTKYDAERFKLVLTSCLERFSDDVVIDCVKLEYIDSAFIGSLLLFQAKLQQQGRCMSLSKANKTVRRILSLNNVIQRFNII